MNLLFITRKIDRHDPRTGFVRGWIDGFAKQLECLKVITLERSDASGLPDNAELESIRNNGKNRFSDVRRYRYLLHKIVPDVDAVFIHQHPVYAIIAADIARKYGKKIFLWYVHKHVDVKLWLAVKRVDAVFTASEESFRLKTKKPVHVVGHGIDTAVFQPLPFPPRSASHPSKRGVHESPLERGVRGVFQILSIGRISPVKGLDVMIEALGDFQKRHSPPLSKGGRGGVMLRIVGDTALERDEEYLKRLKERVEELGIGEMVEFAGSIPHDQIVDEYRMADLFLNLSDTGSLDKSVLEAMACEVLVISSNEAFRAMLKGAEFKDYNVKLFIEKNKEAVASAITNIMNMEDEYKKMTEEALRTMVVSQHGLGELPGKIIKIIQDEYL